MSVTYDVSSKITQYLQTDSRWKSLTFTDTGNTIELYGCALTCAAMCVKKDVGTVYNEGFKKESCDWNGIATSYGKVYNVWTTSYGGIIGLLVGNRPAIVKVGTEAKPHWVVVYRFSGDDTSPKVDDFRCYCPTNGDVVLSKALRYASGCPYKVYSIS